MFSTQEMKYFDIYWEKVNFLFILNNTNQIWLKKQNFFPSHLASDLYGIACLVGLNRV